MHWQTNYVPTVSIKRPGKIPWTFTLNPAKTFWEKCSFTVLAHLKIRSGVLKLVWVGQASPSCELWHLITTFTTSKNPHNPFQETDWVWLFSIPLSLRQTVQHRPSHNDTSSCKPKVPNEVPQIYKYCSTTHTKFGKRGVPQGTQRTTVPFLYHLWYIQSIPHHLLLLRHSSFNTSRMCHLSLHDK